MQVLRNALEIKNISKHYEDFSLRNVSFSVPKGAIVGLIGENGAGKTTTINCILNIIRRNGGDILIWGQDNIRYEKEIKNNIGIVFDDCHFPEIFTANEIESFMQGIYNNWEHSTYQNYLNKFNLPPKKKIKDFSRGMKVKLAFAVALSHSAKLLIGVSI